MLRRVVKTKKNHCATIKDRSMTARAVVLIDLISKAVAVIKNHRAIARATVARAAVVIKMLLAMMVMEQCVTPSMMMVTAPRATTIASMATA